MNEFSTTVNPDCLYFRVHVEGVWLYVREAVENSGQILTDHLIELIHVHRHSRLLQHPQL